jgi:hypothetical protein
MVLITGNLAWERRVLTRQFVELAQEVFKFIASNSHRKMKKSEFDLTVI